MSARTGQWLLIAGGVVIFGALMFAAGWSVAARSATAAVSPTSAAPVQSAPPIQEMIPLPGPDQGQGRGQGEQCEPLILFYYQGRLYQLMPGPQQDPQGRPGSPPEYFPIRPYQGPQIPGLPFQLPPGAPRQPQSPGFQPVPPRF